MLDKIKQIISEIGSFTATTPAEVEQFRIKHLSKKGTIAALFDDFKNVPADQKKEIGKALNELKTAALDKVNELKEKLCNSDQGKTGVDLTLPGDLIKLGSRHPLSIVKNEILAIFNKLGFTISEGPEIEDDWHNFSALNFPEEHPARDMQDTFFGADERLDLCFRVQVYVVPRLVPVGESLTQFRYAHVRLIAVLVRFTGMFTQRLDGLFRRWKVGATHAKVDDVLACGIHLGYFLQFLGEVVFLYATYTVSGCNITHFVFLLHIRLIFLSLLLTV